MDTVFSLFDMLYSKDWVFVVTPETLIHPWNLIVSNIESVEDVVVVELPCCWTVAI